jgi:hypothetical protein
MASTHGSGGFGFDGPTRYQEFLFLQHFTMMMMMIVPKKTTKGMTTMMNTQMTEVTTAMLSRTRVLGRRGCPTFSLFLSTPASVSLPLVSMCFIVQQHDVFGDTSLVIPRIYNC